ncbi:MAG: hypothetical protein ACXWZF_05935 [Actinomycetota bacterium]
MCRALVVLCVADDGEALLALKAATVSAEWELTPGATDLRSALDQIDAERPHVMVAFGNQVQLVGIVRERFPSMRIVTDRDSPGATVVAASLGEVRELVLGLPRPGGPVGA